MTYDQIIRQPGKRIEPKLYYSIENVETIIGRDEIEFVKPHFEAEIIGTLMFGAEAELKVQLPTDIDIYIENKAIFGTNTATKTFGPFRVQEETYNADSRTYTYNLYDEMLQLMIDYEPITITYPCTLFQFFSQFVTEKGCTTNILSLPNGARVLESDPFAGINYTSRDVLNDIGQATATLFKIENKVIKKCELGTTTKVIDDDILMNQNISMGQHYGPVNTIVLSRSSDTDNVYYPNPLPANPIEFKIKNNQLMNNDDRSDYLEDIYDVLNGFEYDIYDCELVGYGGFEPLDKLQINTIENGTTKTYNSYVFNNEIKITQGYDENIFSELPNKTSTDYKYASPTDKAIKMAEIIVNKQEGTISQIVRDLNDDETKWSETQRKQDEYGERFEVVSQNITYNYDENGELASADINNIKTTNGYTFDKNGLNIYTSENSFNTQITNTAVKFKDGNRVISETNKDGVISKDFKQQGLHQYSWNGDSYDFSDERVEINGEYGYATFYNGNIQ